MEQTESLQTYTRTVSTMSQAIDDLREEPDPDGNMAELAERIEVERDWVRMLMDLGEGPLRPPSWVNRLRRFQKAHRLRGSGSRNCAV